MRKLAVIVLALAVSGCGKDKEGGKGAAKTSAGAKSADTSGMFTGDAPTLPDEIAALKFGMSKADAAKALGEEEPGYMSSKKFDKVSYDLRFDKDKTTGAETLTSISVRTNNQLEPVLTSKWKSPAKTEKSAFWFNAATGVRAYLPDHGKGESVTFDQYEPVEKILGEKGNAFALAPDGKPLIGMKLEEFHTAMGAKLCRWDEEGPKLQKAYEEAQKTWNNGLRDAQKGIHICTPVPRTVEQYTSMGDTARFGMDGKLESIHISFQVAKSADLIKGLAATFDKAYGGKPVEVKEKSGAVSRYYFDPAAKTRVKVTMDENWVGLTYGWYLPVAELIGGDKPGLSIEGAHMPVGTVEEMKADDPDHWVSFETLHHLFYPPTEFGSMHTDVDINFMSNSKKSANYRVVVHHTDNEAAGDQVFELLKAKFGEPKVDKRTTDVDKYWTFSKNGRKVSARRVSQQWQIEVTK